jgi:hypothetical protein
MRQILTPLLSVNTPTSSEVYFLRVNIFLIESRIYFVEVGVCRKKEGVNSFPFVIGLCMTQEAAVVLPMMYPKKGVLIAYLICCLIKIMFS